MWSFLVKCFQLCPFVMPVQVFAEMSRPNMHFSHCMFNQSAVNNEVGILVKTYAICILFVLQFLVAISWICTYIWGIFHEFLPLVVYILPQAVTNIQAPPVNFIFSTFGGVWGDGHLWYPQVRIVIYFIQSRIWYIKPLLCYLVHQVAMPGPAGPPGYMPGPNHIGGAGGGRGSFH